MRPAGRRPARQRHGLRRYTPAIRLRREIGATEDAKRLKLQEAQTITKIPVLPISYGDAQPLLAALDRPPWRRLHGAAACPSPYRFGAGPAKVHLKRAVNWDTKTLYDVIAKLPGSDEPDQWIIRGNHHDAWVNGAEDPLSGQVALLEEARSFGEL